MTNVFSVKREYKGIMNRTLICVASCITALFFFAATAFAADKAPTQIRLGYFEAGEGAMNNILRDEFKRQLDAIAPDDTEFVFVPEGYRSASWHRDSCRIDAAQLAGVKTVDMMVAIGPWVVQDLLAAGYTKPIIGMRQIDPLADSLVDAKGNPVVPNLTVQYMPGKIEDDIAMLARLMPVKRLGVLFFPNNEAERDSIMSRIREAGRQLGIDVFTAEGHNKYGTYAYFKALGALQDSVDAVYLGPLWALDVTQIDQFLLMLKGRKLPSFTWEGRFLTARGAFATNYAFGVSSEARFQADKALRIARGEKPSDLPVAYRGGSSLAINEGTAAACNIDVPAEALISAELYAERVPETAERYSILDAVLRATQGNPGFLATFDRIDQAAAAAGEVSAGYRPQVGIDASAGYVDDNTRHNTLEPIANDQYRAGVTLDQSILSVETLRAIKAARKKTDLARIDQRQARLDLELAVHSAYLDHLWAQEKLDIEHRYQEVVERTLELAAARYHLENTGEADMYRWQNERQVAIDRILRARNRLSVSATTLNVLFNLPLDQPMILVDTPAFAAQLMMDYDRLSPLAVKPARRLQFENRLAALGSTGSPDLLAYNARIDLANAEMARNRAGYIPSLSLRARFNLADELDDTGIIDERAGTWSVFGRLNLPLYNGGTRRSERARLKARLNETEFERDNRRLALMGTIHREVGEMATRIAAVPRLDRSKALAIEAMKLVTQDYEGGKCDITVMLEAYRHARDTELSELRVRYEYLEAMARLAHDVGWSTSENGRNFYDEFHERVEGLLAP